MIHSEQNRKVPSDPRIAVAVVVLNPVVPVALVLLSNYFPLVSMSGLVFVGTAVGNCFAIPFAIIAYFRYRSSSLSHAIWIWAGLAVTCPLGAIVLLWSVNCLADSSRPVTHTARVVHCELSYDSSDTSGRVTLRWADDWTRLNASDCDHYYNGSKALVTTKEGALGFLWVSAHRGGECRIDPVRGKTCTQLK